eukprot:765607-Hanusia_phi.AAC.1
MEVKPPALTGSAADLDEAGGGTGVPGLVKEQHQQRGSAGDSPAAEQVDSACRPQLQSHF